jgi:hypothetical protein
VILPPPPGAAQDGAVRTTAAARIDVSGRVSYSRARRRRQRRTASLYAEYSPAAGPHEFITTLYGPPAGTNGQGERVGWRANAENGWVVVLYYRTGTWGYLRGSCLRPE